MAQRAQVFNGRYEIVRPIARGGMAEVYLAHDQLLDRPVALKVLFPELSIDRSFVERFRREAQSAANLSHPNIVSVYDFGDEGGTPFIVMEYVDGRTLTSIIRSEGPLLPDRAAAIGAEVAAALAFAHRNGVVHRDVKPGNVLIDTAGHVKVTDFGIARAANTVENLTQTGAVMGTATYFSPEQAQGAPLDGRTDVYSLGIVLYEMITGSPPFTGDNPVSIAYKHVQEEPAPPRSVNPAIPPAFEAIVLQAMAKDPDQRYGSADELRADLLRYRQGRAVAAVPPPPTVAATRMQTAAVPAADRTRMVSAAEVAPPPPPPRRTGAYVVLLLVMLAALGVLLFLLGRTLGIFGGTTAAKQVEVPRLVNLPVDQAEARLSELGLESERRLEENDRFPANVVFDHTPGPGTKVDEGSTVVLKVSAGAGKVKVPGVTGEKVDDAIATLEAAGLKAEETTQADPSAESGRVLRQTPTAGTEVERGSTVRLLVSSGKPKVEVPNVVDKDESEARDAIVNAGLKVRTVKETSGTVAAGKVIRTDPQAGTEVDQASTVTLVVSSGPEQVEVPNVIGQTEDQAKATLTGAGFKVKVEEVVVLGEPDDGRVVDQDPDAGVKAAKGSTVTIRVGKKP